jgi:hypothetical protein
VRWGGAAQVLGTPEPEVLAKFKAHGAAHVNFDFPYQKGIGIAQLIPHASPDCIDLMMKVRPLLAPRVQCDGVRTWWLFVSS